MALASQPKYKASVADDPLLYHLCTVDPKNEPLYAEVKLGQAKQQYSVAKEFPFYGHRLVALQQFIVEQNPSDLYALWHDRRDVRKHMLSSLPQCYDSLTRLVRHYTFWAVIGVGGTSMILSFLQIIVGILQIVLN